MIGFPYRESKNSKIAGMTYEGVAVVMEKLRDKEISKQKKHDGDNQAHDRAGMKAGNCSRAIEKSGGGAASSTSTTDSSDIGGFKRRSKTSCRYWNGKEGSCSNGNKCQFQHVEWTGVSSSSSKASTKCIYWKKGINGSCGRGDKCEYLHLVDWTVKRKERGEVVEYDRNDIRHSGNNRAPHIPIEGDRNNSFMGKRGHDDIKYDVRSYGSNEEMQMGRKRIIQTESEQGMTRRNGERMRRGSSGKAKKLGRRERGEKKMLRHNTNNGK